MSFRKNYKDFSATVTSGSPCIIQDTESQISIEVEKGTRAVIMQHIHTNLEALQDTTSRNECIVSPVVTIHNMVDDPQHLVKESRISTLPPDKDKIQSSGMQIDFERAHSSHMYLEPSKYFLLENLKETSLPKFKLTIPHYVEDENLVALVEVKWGSIDGKLRKMRKETNAGKDEPYCEVNNDHVVVYANHVCDVVCTCPEKVCDCKLWAYPFGQKCYQPEKDDTIIEMKTYLCSHLYQDKSLKKVQFHIFNHPL